MPSPTLLGVFFIDLDCIILNAIDYGKKIVSRKHRLLNMYSTLAIPPSSKYRIHYKLFACESRPSPVCLLYISYVFSKLMINLIYQKYILERFSFGTHIPPNTLYIFVCFDRSTCITCTIGKNDFTYLKNILKLKYYTGYILSIQWWHCSASKHCQYNSNII